jgi:hypothetical protein
MTIAIALTVDDGIVLAADSASTLMSREPNGQSRIHQVFNNANKVFNLRKGLPIGLIVWGAGGIGSAGIATLVKDLRMRLTDSDTAHKGWHVDPAAYAISHVAELTRRFIYEEHYVPAFTSWTENKPPFGCIVAGYSSGSGTPELFRIDVSEKGECGPPQPVTLSLVWNGELEPICRLVNGYGTGIVAALQKLGVREEQLAGVMSVVQELTSVQFVYPAMPVQDAIDLAEFLVLLTEQYSRYTPGAATVGGPIEIAAVTKHEGFKWVKRKLYYSAAMNPVNTTTQER